MAKDSKKNNNKGNGLNEMELAATKNKKMNEASVEAAFPLPKFLFVLHSPVQVVVEKATVENEMVKSIWKDFTSDSFANSNNKKKKIKVKMRSLILKMINRLIRDRLIPAEAM